MTLVLATAHQRQPLETEMLRVLELKLYYYQVTLRTLFDSFLCEQSNK